MSEESCRLFLVTCKNCNRLLVTVARIRDPEIALLIDHIRACCRPDDPLGNDPPLGDVLRNVRVAATAA